MTHEDKVQPRQHKEEMNSRIRTDAQDRSKIRQKFQESVDPLASSSHPDAAGIIQIVSGRICADTTVNIDEAVSIGEMMEQYERTWPGGFYDTIPKKVHTMNVTKKHVQVGETKVYDPTLFC